ncbi:MAG: hypothetical protein EPN40_00770 [Rhodanobacteraceae bacterium]|nr:MAG: hypothetical protein EPN40_00770 [Rhodanobacteraceae bacterium]
MDAKAITDVSLDLGQAYVAGARGQCPHARISFDPFHVIALAHTALDHVRRAEVKGVPDLKGVRWGTLKDASHWTRNQPIDMHWLQHSGLQTTRAWRIKECLRDHLEGILAHFDTHLDKGFAEAINGCMQAAKARARGYGTDCHLAPMWLIIVAMMRPPRR